jgi:hypothetical protein
LGETFGFDRQSFFMAMRLIGLIQHGLLNQQDFETTLYKIDYYPLANLEESMINSKPKNRLSFLREDVSEEKGNIDLTEDENLLFDKYVKEQRIEGIPSMLNSKVTFIILIVYI